MGLIYARYFLVSLAGFFKTTFYRALSTIFIMLMDLVIFAVRSEYKLACRENTISADFCTWVDIIVDVVCIGLFVLMVIKEPNVRMLIKFI